MNLKLKYDKIPIVVPHRCGISERYLKKGVSKIKFFRINNNIQNGELRVIGPDGEQIGVISKMDALAKAQELELDLIEVAPNAKPPVARILDFKKFKYEESKKEKAAKKGEGASGLKELWLSPRIAEHDLKVRLSRAEDFLSDGFKVKLTVKFKGREMAHTEFGYQVLQKSLNLLGEKVAVERDAKMEGRKMSIILAKSKGVKTDAETKN